MGAKRVSQMEYKGSQEVLEPPSAYPTPAWLMRENEAAHNRADKPHSPRVVVSNELPSFLTRSSSSENVAMATGLAEMTKAASHLPHTKRQSTSAASFEPDVVAIHVSKTSNVRGSVLPEEDANQKIYHSFQSPIGKGGTGSDGDATPTNERKCMADTLETSAASEAFIEEIKLTPKAKPIAKIVARTKRVSRELPTDAFDGGYELGGGSMAYSTATLPRHSSKKKVDRIYDNPAELSAYIDGAVSGGVSCGQFAGGRGRLSSVGAGKPRKAPPPPPKRTNSMKNDIRFHRELLEKASSSFSGCETIRRNSADSEGRRTVQEERRLEQQGNPATPGDGHHASHATDQTPHEVRIHQIPHEVRVHQIPQEVRVHQQIPRSPAQKHHRTSSRDRHVINTSQASSQGSNLMSAAHAVTSHTPAVTSHGLTTVTPHTLTVTSQSPQHRRTLSRDRDDFPPPPPPLSATEHSVASLNNVIQQLEQHVSTHGPPEQPGESQQKQKDKSPGAAAAGLEPSASMGSIDSNTLPFANENVGTIKQRSTSSKPSIVTRDGEGDDATVDLDQSLFEDGSSTVKRNKKANPPGQYMCDPQYKKLK